MIIEQNRDGQWVANGDVSLPDRPAVTVVSEPADSTWEAFDLWALKARLVVERAAAPSQTDDSGITDRARQFVDHMRQQLRGFCPDRDRSGWIRARSDAALSAINVGLVDTVDYTTRPRDLLAVIDGVSVKVAL